MFDRSSIDVRYNFAFSSIELRFGNEEEAMVKRGMVGSEEWKSGKRLKKYQRQQGTDFSHTITRGVGGTLQERGASFKREQRVMSSDSGWKPVPK